MSPEDLNRHQTALLAKKEAVERLARTRAFSRTPPHGDDGDRSMAANDDEIVIQLQQNDAKLLRAIDKALARIEAGEFGICSDCEEDIPQPRLDAVPWTRVCVPCKTRQSG